MFSKAIVRTPAPSMIHGLTSAGLGVPDYSRACAQHESYIRALEACGLSVTCLEPLDSFPDSTFVEDVALVTRKGAVITRPGAETRRQEIEFIKAPLEQYFQKLSSIEPPGTLEAGDIMMVGDHFYIGLSARTNIGGASQMISHLRSMGLSGSTLRLKDMLHLKTGVAYLENNYMVVCGEFVDHPLFSEYNRLVIPDEESYAANCIWVNDRVLMPSGFPKAKQQIQNTGYEIIELDMSEFQKLDGGLSCLSLRF